MQIENQEGDKQTNPQLAEMQIQKETKKHDPNFLFPIALLQPTVFQDVNQINKKLADEQEQLENTRKVVWLKNYLPSIKKCERIYVNCKFCPAYIYFDGKEGKQFVIVAFNNQHSHPEPKPVKQTQQKNKKKQGNKKNGSTDLPQTRVRKQIIHTIPPTLIEVSKQSKQFDIIETFLKSKKFQYKYYWTLENPQKQTNNRKIPNLIVAVSSSMKQTYQKFGRNQIISLDIVWGAVKQKSAEDEEYGIGLFTGWDSNERFLIFGIALLVGQSKEVFQKIFTDFFQLAGGQPQSIVVNMQSNQVQALQSLKQKSIYLGITIEDPYVHIKQLTKKITLPKMQKIQKIKQRRKFANIFKQIINQKFEPIGLRKLIGLAKSALGSPNQGLIIQFIEKAQKICLWKCAPLFVGINRCNNKQIDEIIKQDLLKQSELITVLRNITGLAEELKEVSASDFQQFSQELQKVFADPNLGEVRKNLQKNAFNIFLQNYFGGCKDYRIKGEIVADQTKFQVYNMNTGDLFIVQNFSCSCRYVLRTGIPCDHVILVKYTLKKSYLDIIHPRWIKQNLDFTQKQQKDSQPESKEEIVKKRRKRRSGIPSLSLRKKPRR